MDGDFYVAASLATTLTKVALRYVAIAQDKKQQNVSSFVFVVVSHKDHTFLNIIQPAACFSDLLLCCCPP